MCSPRPAARYLQSHPLSPARCVHTAFARRLARPAACGLPRALSDALLAALGTVRDGLQPAAVELGHLPCDEHGPHVFRVLLPAPRPSACPLPSRCVHRERTRRLLCASRPAPALAAPCALRPLWQWAFAFNQPLSWDTSRVTIMRGMFSVSCSQPQPPQAMQLHPLPCTLRAPRLLAARRASPGARSPPRLVRPACDPRQRAYAFNQALGWDISSVTDKSRMFKVRCSPRALPPNLCSQTPCPRGTSRTASPCIPTGSAG